MGTWEAPVLLNQTWVHTAECNKASLRRQVVVKEREAVIIRAPKQRGLVACDLNPGLPEGFQQSSHKGHTREGVTECMIRWCMVLWWVR